MATGVLTNIGHIDLAIATGDTRSVTASAVRTALHATTANSAAVATTATCGPGETRLRFTVL